MPLLSDTQLHAELTAHPDYIQGFNAADWTRSDSPIQPSSVDLHVGTIYCPGESTPEAPDRLIARKTLKLSTGQTAVITTQECLTFPLEWSAYGFPPSHLSAKGLLMTNPGHVDPGFSGKLRFTVINMSAEPFHLTEGDAIVTLLIHKLETPAEHGFNDRRTADKKGALGDPTWNEVSVLAKDFVNVETRSKAIATDAIKANEAKTNRWTAGIAAVAAVLGIAATAIVNHFSGVQALQNDVNDVKSKIEIVEVKNQIKTLSDRVTSLEKAAQQNAPNKR
jgi:dCTP deaminase